MSLLNLPPEILYDILGEVIASYIDRAITSPPIGGWETMESKGRSEWYTDDDNYSNGDTDLDTNSNGNGSDDDGSLDPDAEIDDDNYDSEYSDEDDDTSLSGASADDELSDIDESEELLSIPSTSGIRPPEQIVPSARSDEREQTATETGPEAAIEFLDSAVLNDTPSLWALQQERKLDPGDIPAFKLFFGDFLERREKLPVNDIATLLSVCHSLRGVTIKLVSDTLGFDNKPKECVDYNPWFLLRLLRRHYRFAHTQPFDLPEPEYPARMTPLVQCYYSLSDLSFSLRRLGRLEGPETVLDMLPLFSMASDIPQLVFRSRIAQRTHILLIHLRRYISVSMYCADISSSYKDMFSLRGTARRPAFIIHEDKIPNFVKAIQTFVNFDRKHMDRRRYPELPGPLVDLCGVVRVLSNVKKLKYVLEFRRQPDIMAATTDAIGLMEKWKRRAEISSYIVVED